MRETIHIPNTLCIQWQNRIKFWNVTHSAEVDIFVIQNLIVNIFGHFSFVIFGRVSGFKIPQSELVFGPDWRGGAD